MGLYDALATVKDAAHPSRGIVVRELARLARDVIIQETVIRGIQKDGDLVFSTDSMESSVLSGEDTSEHTRKLVRTVLGAINEFNRVQIVIQMSNGRKLADAQGKFAYGAPRYGQAVAPHDSGKGSKLVEVPSEQLVIRRIGELRDSGLSIRAVAAALNEEGHETRHGGPWASSSVAKVLNRS